jgi:putative tryptophan/tyrosine transport system substrate-binding protein
MAARDVGTCGEGQVKVSKIMRTLTSILSRRGRGSRNPGKGQHADALENCPQQKSGLSFESLLYEVNRRLSHDRNGAARGSQDDGKFMRQRSFLRFLAIKSDNLKSKTCTELSQRIQNPKLLGLVALAVAFALCGSVADAQQTGKIFRIGYLDNSTASGSAVFLEAFRQELSKLGWFEGKNITIEYRFAEQKLERLPELAADLVRLKVDLIVTSGGPTPLAAKGATTTIPIVMTTSVDPVAAGLIASLARPGGNVTGISGLVPEVISKRLEILKDAIPRLSRVGLLRSPVEAYVGDLQLKELRPAALALKLKLEEIEMQPDPQGLESAFKTAKQKQVNAIMTTPGRRFFAERKRIVELAVKYRLPAIYPDKEFVDEGGLMSYGGGLR